MTVYLKEFLLRIPNMHRVYVNMVLANPTHQSHNGNCHTQAFFLTKFQISLADLNLRSTSTRLLFSSLT
jgi:hypothetical protein